MNPMSVGPFVLGAPLALAALIALPVLWFILRATPPAPKNVELPSLRLLDGVEPREETPDRTPWWVLLLRILAVVAAVLVSPSPYTPPPDRQKRPKPAHCLSWSMMAGRARRVGMICRTPPTPPSMLPVGTRRSTSCLRHQKTVP